jgi:hypothetical protein
MLVALVRIDRFCDPPDFYTAVLLIGMYTTGITRSLSTLRLLCVVSDIRFYIRRLT